MRPAPVSTTLAAVANGRYIRSRKPRSSLSHQVHPPSSKSPTTRRASRHGSARAPHSPRAWSLAGGQHAFPHSCAGDGHDAGEEEQAEAAEQNPERALERQATVGTAETGTITVPAPCAPFTATVTLFEPGAMIQSRVEYQPSAPATGFATSGGGAPALASYMFTIAVTWSGLASGTCTLMSAIPGITPGSRTYTTTRYGPAAPSYQTSGLPTWAEQSAARPATPRGRGDEPSGSSHHARHPAAPPEPDPCRSHRDEEREGEAARERHGVEVAHGVLRHAPEPVLPWPRLHHVGPLVRREEVVPGGGRQQELPEAPLHRGSSDTNAMPRPAANSQSLRRPARAQHEIDRERRHDEEQRKLGRHHVGDSRVDRSELRLGGKELEDPDGRQDDAHVHRGTRGGRDPEPAGAAEGHEKHRERAAATW